MAQADSLKEHLKVSSNTGSANADTDLTLADPGDGSRNRVHKITVSCSGATVGDAQVLWMYDGSATDIVLGALTFGGRGNVFSEDFTVPLPASHSAAPKIRAKAAGASTVLTVTATYDTKG